MDLQKEEDSSDFGNQSLGSINLTSDLISYMYDKITEDLKGKGYKDDLIRSCIPDWYSKLKDGL